MMHVEVGPTNLYNAGRGQLVKLEKTAGSSAGLLCAACADGLSTKENGAVALFLECGS